MDNQEFINLVLQGYGDILAVSLPIALFIGACNVAANLLISACFGGKLRIGRGD